MSQSIIRRTLLWWFRWPANPWLSVSVACDFSAARAYLAGLKGGAGPRVTVQHLVLGMVARLLHEAPEANARAVGRSIERMRSIGAVVPVDLVGHAGGRRRESSIALVERMERMSLRDIAAAVDRSASTARAGRDDHALVRAMTWVAERTPDALFELGLDLVDRASRAPRLSRWLGERLSISTAVSNPGAVFAGDRFAAGGVLRGFAAGPPDRILHLGTIWVLGTVQDEVVPVDGRPEVRPMLPLTLLADHRIVDGVAIGRLLARGAAILAAPAETFGPDGERVIGG